MKKSSFPSKLQDHLGSQLYRSKRCAAPRADEVYADPSPRKPRPRISYIPGEIPPPLDETPPPLLVHGLLGGSINMDLRGLSVPLSKAAFAHWVPDESLRCLHIHRGDIAIIDRMHGILSENNIVLLDNGSEWVLRRLRRRHQIWYLETADESGQPPVPLTTQPLLGAVVGVLRLFTATKAARYTKSADGLRQSAPGRQTHLVDADSTSVSKKEVRGTKASHRSSAKPNPVALAAEELTTYRPKPRKKKQL